MRLPAAERARIVEAVRAAARDDLDEDLGDLRAGLLVDLVLREAGPAVYAQAVRDAQAHLAAAVADLDVNMVPPGVRR